MTGLPSVLVLGAGSIGRRHATNLVRLGAQVFVADPDAERTRNVEGAQAVPYDLAALEGYDGVVVASPTRHHAAQAAAAVEAGCRVLVEKPLAMTPTEAIPLAAASDRVMVGYNLRFHEPIRRLRAMTEAGQAGPVRSARFWFGSYLPDWRPGVDYRQSYSARADLGGGVLLDAIHELDLIVWWFGEDVEVRAAVVSQVGALEIDVEDMVNALLVASGGVPVQVSLDYLSRRYRRGIELVGDDATLRYDWARGALEVETASGIEAVADETPISRSYECEAEHFLAWLNGDTTPEVDARTGLASLRLADDIRRLGR